MRVRSFMCVHSFVLFVVVCSFPKQLVLNGPILMFSPCERIARSEIDGSGVLHRFVSPAPRPRLCFFSNVFERLFVIGAFSNAFASPRGRLPSGHQRAPD